ncbi:MAG: chitobiase/beta-hexosaminidase C-terminal domain-containing protein [Prevotella sp.]|nr:chitobiase/beta-hexosaminidase C-terminal domain-containing protein [Prevotella sp.]
MNKFLRYSLICALAMICGSISAQEVTLDFESNEWGLPEGSTNKTVDKKDYSNGTYTITLEGSEGNGYYWHNKDLYLFMGKQGAKLTLPAFDFDVEKIEVTGTGGASTAVKQNVFVGETAVSEETTGMKGVTQAYNIAEAYQKAGNVYTIQVTSAHNTQIKKIMIYKKGSGGGTISVAPPTIKGTSPFDESTEVTISAEGYTIYYTTDGSTPDATSQSGKNSVTLTLTETTKVSAIATDGEDHWSMVVSSTFKKSEPAAEITVAQALEIINALEDGKTTSEEYTVKGFIVGTPDFQRKTDNSLYGNCNFDIADSKGGSTTLTVFRAKSFENKSFTEEDVAAPILKEGDEVVLIGKLQKYVKNETVTPELTSCYLISVNGQTSNVNAIEAENNANAPAFNLAGQRVNNSFKGIVIKNGKKYIK